MTRDCSRIHASSDGDDQSSCDRQVDSALLGHPLVAEAVSFGAPSEKYGEIVAAAVVLSGGADKDAAAVAADIRKFAGGKLAQFKVRHRPQSILLQSGAPA